MGQDERGTDGLSDPAIRALLLGTRRIALVGASARPERASHEVMRFLLDRGYDVTPVNPFLAGQRLHGRTVVASLAEAAPLDLVDVFRNRTQAGAVVDAAIRLGARAVWLQLGVIDPDAAARARGGAGGGDASLSRDRVPPARAGPAGAPDGDRTPMTNEERDLITAFIARVAGAAPAPSGQAWGSPSVPAIPAPPLPPIDPEADALLAALFQRYPEARYRLAQFAFVHEHALAAAQARIQQLEAQLRPPAPAPAHGGFFSGLFGGGRSAPPPGSPPGGYPPGGYPGGAPPLGMLPRSGSGFLGSALTTAAGVAGGMVLGNALMNMFSSGSGATAAELPAEDPWSTPLDPNSDPAGWTDPANDPMADPDPGDGGWDPGGGGDDTLI